MEEFNRKKVRNNLNNQRNRLRAKGASPAEITDYFGFPENKPFGELTDIQLKRIADKRHKNPVSVVNGYIYPIKYLQAHKIWFEGEKNVPLVKGLKKSLESNFIKNDKNIETTKKRKNERDFIYKKAYSKALENIGLKKISKEVKKMSYKQLKNFIKSGQGLLDLNVVYADTNIFREIFNNEDNEYEQETQRNITINETIEKLWKNFNNEKI